MTKKPQVSYEVPSSSTCSILLLGDFEQRMSESGSSFPKSWKHLFGPGEVGGRRITQSCAIRRLHIRIREELTEAREKEAASVHCRNHYQH